MSSIVSPIRWVGGKRKTAPLFRRSLDVLFAGRHRRHTPFFGAGNLFFAEEQTADSSYVLSDANLPLMCMWRAVQDAPRELYKARSAVCSGFTYGQSSESGFVTVRGRLNAFLAEPARTVQDLPLERCVEVGALLMVFSAQAHGGLYRVNSSGEINVGYQGDRQGLDLEDLLPSRDQLQGLALALGAAELHSGDFEARIDAAKPGEAIYCDPPYPPPPDLSAPVDMFGNRPLKEGAFDGYTAEGFSFSDHCRLARACRRAVERDVAVAVSGPWEEGWVRLWQSHGFTAVPLQVGRSISRTGEDRGQVTEVLLLGHRDPARVELAAAALARRAA